MLNSPWRSFGSSSVTRPVCSGVMLISLVVISGRGGEGPPSYHHDEPGIVNSTRGQEKLSAGAATHGECPGGRGGGGHRGERAAQSIERLLSEHSRPRPKRPKLRAPSSRSRSPSRTRRPGAPRRRTTS